MELRAAMMENKECWSLSKCFALGNLDSSCEWTGGWGVQVVRAEGGSIYLVVQWRQQDLWGFGCHPVTRCTFFPCIMGPDDTSWRLPVNNLEVMSFIELYIVLNLWLRPYGTHGGGEMRSACCSRDNVKTMLPSQVLATNICGKTKPERWAEHKKKTCKKQNKKTDKKYCQNQASSLAKIKILIISNLCIHGYFALNYVLKLDNMTYARITGTLKPWDSERGKDQKMNKTSHILI